MNHFYPFESHYLTIKGVRYHYLDEGEGEILLMVHGNPTWSFFYRELVSNFRDRYRVIVPDHIGCGLSDKPASYNYTLQQHIHNLSFLIEAIQLSNINLFMHDWGGPIAMGYAVRHPDSINRLIIFNTAAFWFPQIPMGIKLLRNSMLGWFFVQRLNLFAWLGTVMACQRKPMSKQVKQGYLAPYNSVSNRIGLLRFIQDIPLHPDHVSYPVLRSVEKRLPVLKDHKKMIVWGGKDPVFNMDFLDEWKKHFPDVSTRVIDDAGHYVVEDAIDLIIPWIEEFLGESIQN